MDYELLGIDTLSDGTIVWFWSKGQEMAGVVNTEYRGLLFGKPSQPTNSTGGREMTDDFWGVR